MAKPSRQDVEALIGQAHSQAHKAIAEASIKIIKQAEAISCSIPELYKAFPEAKAAMLDWLESSANLAQLQADALQELIAQVNNGKAEAGSAIAGLQELFS